MDLSQRLVTQLPLTELWTDRGIVAASRERLLGRDEVKGLLQAGPIQFVIADVGAPLRWVPEDDRFVFWKLDAKSHIVEDPDSQIDIYAYPEGMHTLPRSGFCRTH